ncbi:MAG: CinA family protein [Xanthobacteraceae bacterium]|jgi:nicotinamide-nucleotide amidase
MALSTALTELARRALEVAKACNCSIVTAESCTAGKLSGLLSEAPGAGALLHGGFVSYTKANKTKALGVSPDLLAQKGAVCVDVAVAMANGALARSPANVAVAITGVAGPKPDEDGNPVGLVCIAVTRQGAPPICFERRYENAGREAVQDQAMADALTALIDAMKGR